MPFNGGGTFTIVNTFTPNTTISSSAVNTNFSDIATGLTAVETEITTLNSLFAEDTFTPVLAFGGASTGITYAVQLGNYVKIGKLVYIDINIELTSNGSATGDASITGLPFTSNATTTAILTFQCDNIIDNGGNIAQFCPSIASGATQVLLDYDDFDATNYNAQTLNEGNIADTTQIKISGSYISST